jgi:hypothetical protein
VICCEDVDGGLIRSNKIFRRILTDLIAELLPLILTSLCSHPRELETCFEKAFGQNQV